MDGRSLGTKQGRISVRDTQELTMHCTALDPLYLVTVKPGAVDLLLAMCQKLYELVVKL